MSFTYLLDEGGPVKAANVVSLLRGILIVPIMLLLVRHMNGASLGLYLLAVATDGLDGWLARRSGRCSEFGAVLDSVIDNLFSIAIAGFLWLAVPDVYNHHPVATTVLFLGPLVYLAVSRAMSGQIIMFHFHSARLGAVALFALWPGLALTGSNWLVLPAAFIVVASRIEQVLFMARGGRDPDARSVFEAIPASMGQKR